MTTNATRALQAALPWTRSHARRIMLGSAAVAALYLALIGILDHEGLRTQYNDLGHMEQAIWQVTRGHFSMPLSDPHLGQSRLAMHGNVILYLVAPLYALLPSSWTLLALAAVAGAAGGVLLFYLARAVLHDELIALCFGLAFLLNPLVQETVLFDFHPDVLALPLFLGAALSAHRRRWIPYWICTILLLTVKEDMPAVAAVLGLFVAWRGDWKRGGPTVLLAILYGVAAAWLTQNLAGTYTGSIMFYRYAYLGHTPGEALTTFLTRPWTVLPVVVSAHQQRYLGYLLMQGFIGLLSPLSLAGLPNAALNLLDSSHFQSRLSGVYYSGIIIAALYAGSVYGLATLRARWPRIARFAQGAFLIQVVVITLIASPTPYGAYSEWRDFLPLCDRSAFARMIAQIPPNAAVATQNNLGAHLSRRDQLFLYPHNFDKAEYLFFHIQIPHPTLKPAFLNVPSLMLGASPFTYRSYILGAFDLPEFGILDYDPPFYLFQRGHDRARNDEALRSALQDLDRLQFVDGVNAALLK